MVEESFQFLSSDGKTQIHGVRFMPEGKNWNKVLQISHGMQEHILRYREFAEFLTKRKFLVVGHDHLGHGDSVTSQKELGFFTEKNPSDTLAADMHTLRTMVQKENEGMPYFMLGHSMGSYMLRKYITLHGEGLSGVILVGTGSMPQAAMKLGMGLCRMLALIFGWHFQSAFVRMLSFMGPYRQYDVNGKVLEKNWLTKDLDIADRYYKDEKCNYRFTVNGYYGLMEAVYYDGRGENINRIPKDLPVFFVSGDKDPVGDMGKGMMKVYRQFKKAGMSDLTWKLYKDDRHEVLNEVDREQVYRNIASWMGAKVNKS